MVNNDFDDDEKDNDIDKHIKNFKFFYESWIDADELMTLEDALTAYNDIDQRKKDLITERLTAAIRPPIKLREKDNLPGPQKNSAEQKTIQQEKEEYYFPINSIEQKNKEIMEEIAKERRWALISPTWYVDEDKDPILTEYTVKEDIFDEVEDGVFNRERNENTNENRDDFQDDDHFDFTEKIVCPVSVEKIYGHYFCYYMTFKEIMNYYPMFPEEHVGKTERVRLDKISITKLSKEDFDIIEQAINIANIDKPDLSEHYAETDGDIISVYLLVRKTKNSLFSKVINEAFGHQCIKDHWSENDFKDLLDLDIPKPLNENEEETWVEYLVKNTREGILQFACQHCQNVTIASPPYLRDELKKRLTSLI